MCRARTVIEMDSDDLPEFRWCVHFETVDGKSSWLDQIAKHPAGAKKATIDELGRMGHDFQEFYSVTRTEAKQSRAAMRMMWGEPDGPVDLFFDIVIGRLFDRERDVNA